MERLPNLYHVPGVTPHMEYHYANNRRHPTEQVFRSLPDRPVYDLNNTMEYVCDSSRALHMLAPPEPSSRSTLLLDIVQATRKRPSMNSENHCPSEYSGLATSSKSYDAFYDSRSPEEVNSLSRRPVHGLPRDCLSSSRPSPVGIPRPIRDGEVSFAGLTASKVVDCHGIPHSAHKDLESALAGLEMDNILRDHFLPDTSARSFSTHNPTSMERRELQAPPLVESTLSPSSQAECNASSGPSEGFKWTRTRASTTTIDGSEQSRPKRQRTRGDSTGETQRMTHITVERNRRKQMNDHLCTLRELMPSSFVQKTDQASIIGAAVEYVKELEVTLESLQSILRSRRAMAAVLNPSWNGLNIHTWPALSATASYADAGCWTPSSSSATTTSEDAVHGLRSRRPTMSPKLFSIPEDSRVTTEVDKVESRSAPVAKVEVRFLGEDAIVNIVAQWKEKKIAEVIVAVESLFLTILHTSVNTVNNTVLCAFYAKVGPDCKMSANEIAAALHQILNCQLI